MCVAYRCVDGIDGLSGCVGDSVVVQHCEL